VKYLLDSNIIIAAISASSSRLRERMAMCDEDDMVTSAIAYAEVAHGAMNGKPPPLDIIDAFLESIPVLPFDQASAPLRSGKLRQADRGARSCLQADHCHRECP
jgi:tRNA(fMet)-specific endonuclease VapC